VTEQQLLQAVRAQGRSYNPKRLGEILLDMGFISKEQLDWLLDAQAKVLARQREAAQRAQQEAQQQAEAQRSAARGGPQIEEDIVDVPLVDQPAQPAQPAQPVEPARAGVATPAPPRPQPPPQQLR